MSKSGDEIKQLKSRIEIMRNVLIKTKNRIKEQFWSSDGYCSRDEELVKEAEELIKIKDL